MNAARAYYETGFRRYVRALGVIKTRTVEKNELIGAVSAEASNGTQTTQGIQQAYERLRFAELDVEGEGAVLGYLSDDKDYVSSAVRLV